MFGNITATDPGRRCFPSLLPAPRISLKGNPKHEARSEEEEEDGVLQPKMLSAAQRLGTGRRSPHTAYACWGRYK